MESNSNSEGFSSQRLSEPGVLVVQTAFLGDLLLSIPLLRRLKQTYRGAPLILVARKGLARVMLDLGVVDLAYEITKGNRQSYELVMAQLTNQKFQLVISPHESMTSAFFVNGLSAEKKIGYHKWWNFFAFDIRVKKNQNYPDAIRQLSLLATMDRELDLWLLDVDQKNLNQPDRLGILPEVPIWASMSLREQLVKHPSPVSLRGRVAVIFPGSVWATKRWTHEGFLAVARFLESQGHHVLWAGALDEKELCDRFEKELPQTKSVAGMLSLNQMLVLLSHAELVVSNDSGGQHLAAVAGAPTVSIFGPTVLGQGFRPWNSKAVIAEVHGLECRPCGRHGHQKCPIKTHACMKSLSPDLVIGQIQRLLAK